MFGLSVNEYLIISITTNTQNKMLAWLFNLSCFSTNVTANLLFYYTISFPHIILEGKPLKSRPLSSQKSMP